MYYSYVEVEYVATSFSPARMDLAVKLLRYNILYLSSIIQNGFIHGHDKQQQDILRKLVKDDVDPGFVLPLPLNKIASVPGILLAPLNVQLQKTIN
jgi:hypothetical protein